MVSVMGESVSLKRVGRKLRGLCPFHPEKTPSFYVDDSKGLFYCFGCQAGGDLFKFIMMRENVEFLDAVKLLARRSGIPIPESRHGGSSERESLLAAHRAAAEFFHKTLLERPEGKPARAYLQSRGLSELAITQLQIGFAPDRWDSLKGHLAAKGHPTNLLVTGGLLSQHPTKGSTYDRFRNRIMFPIRSLTGDVVGFGGRLIGPGEPKYLNSAETPLYNKREHLYGLDQTRQGIRSLSEAVVVEGYFDFASLFQAGVTNVVATLGTAFAEEQVSLLRRFTKKVVVNYDADDAGASATLRSVGLLVAKGLRVRVLRLESGKDPDEFVRQRGLSTYQALLDEAPNYFDYLLESAAAGKDLSDYEKKSEVLREILPALAQVPDRIERSGYVTRLAEKLAISDELMLADVREALLKGPQPATATPRIRAAATGAPTESETRLLRALLEAADLRAELLAHLSAEDLEGSSIEMMVRAVIGLCRQGSEITYAGLSEILGETERSVLARLAMRSQPIISRDEALRCVESLKLKRLRKEREGLQKEMEKEIDAARLDELMRRKMDVSRQIDALS